LLKAAHRCGGPDGIDANIRLKPDDGTIRHEIVLFRRTLKDCIKRNGLLESCGMLLTTHACFLVDLPRKAKPRTRRLSDDEISRILAAVGNPLMRACICFHSLTSLRRSEVVSLRWDNYDRKRNVILLREPGFVIGVHYSAAGGHCIACQCTIAGNARTNRTGTSSSRALIHGRPRAVGREGNLRRY